MPTETELIVYGKIDLQKATVEKSSSLELADLGAVLLICLALLKVIPM